MLAMGLLLMREGLSYLLRSEPVAHPITYQQGRASRSCWPGRTESRKPHKPNS